LTEGANTDQPAAAAAVAATNVDAKAAAGAAVGTAFTPATLPDPKPAEPVVDPLADVLADALADGIWQGNATAPRSLQTQLGFSQLGSECDRRLMHHLRATPPVNFSPDPLRSIVGTGVHLVLADYWRRLDGRTGRYLVEQPVLWQGIPGSVDLFDRRRRFVIDWKTTDLKKVTRYRAQGPSYSQVVQVQGYGAALQASGETVDNVALAWIPIDGELSDIYVWRAPLDVAIPQRAIDRLAYVSTQKFPATATPSALCKWCPFYRPGSIDLSISCPGKDLP
jgi:hypothetical protein